MDKIYADDGKGYAKILHNSDRYYIELYDDTGRLFHTLDNFEGRSIHYVEDAAYNWATGILKLENVA